MEFISNPAHTMTEENIFRLYETAVGAFLPEEDRLLPGSYYRHDAVYVVGEKVEHTGIGWEKLKDCMGDLIAFMQDPNADERPAQGGADSLLYRLSASLF